MWYCPQCGAEYREGTSSCSDCHVLLAKERPRSYEQESLPEPGDPNRDPFCAFWKGTDARICAELCTVLDEAGIPHKTIHRIDHLFNFANQAPFELGVPASLYERAEGAVREAFGTEAHEANEILNPTEENRSSYRALMKLPFNEKWSGRPEEERPSLLESLTWKNRGEEKGGEADALRIPVSDEWFPEDATAEVWSGDPPELQEIIEMSLRENDVRTRWESSGEKPVAFVLPEDEARARDIIREITDSTPRE